MRTAIRVGILATLLLCLGPTSVPAEDVIIGAIWEVQWKNPETKKYQSFGLIRCTRDGKVYKDGKVVGTHNNRSLLTVVFQITDASSPRANGTIKVTRVTKAGTIWEGVHKNKQGEELPIRMFLKKD